MITLTIREALTDDRAITPGYVYVVRDGDTIFYVGSSKDPTFRLCQHLGIADGWNTYTYPPEKLIQDMEKNQFHSSAIFVRSLIGDCIINNAPQSLEWSFDIYETEDAIASMKQTTMAQSFTRVLEIMASHWYNQKELVENALIDQLKPYLNVMSNAHERNLPAKYKSGINLDDNAVDYIRLGLEDI